MKNKHIVIIGNGIAGSTCARFLRKHSNCKITIVSSESKYFFSRTALMYVYMGHMKFEHLKPYEDNFWAKNRIELICKKVERILTDSQQLQLCDGSSLNYDELVIASGSRYNKFGWQGQDLDGVQGLYHLQDLELMEKNTKNARHAVVVGGGLIGIEMTEMLLSRGISVSFLVRENNFWENVLPIDEAKLLNRHILEHHADLQLATELKEIKSDDKGRCSSVITSKGEEIVCDFVGLTVGVSPNISFLEGSGIETQRGVLVDDFLETSIPHIYAIGDCAQLRAPQSGRRPMEAVWYAGRMHGEVLAQTLSGKKTAFTPGHWFNSAKFFDIEYQTYGLVPPQNNPDETSFYWEHDSGKISFRAVYDKQTKVLKGINVFGIRLRHDVVDGWLTRKIQIEEVIDRLPEANFDPEFYSAYESAIKRKYLQENRSILNELHSL